MKKLMLAAVVASLAVPAAAAPGKSATATDGKALAKIIAPITIKHVSTAALNFGTILPDVDAASVVTVTAATSTTTTSGSVTSGSALLIDSTAVAADGFDVTGDANRNFTITTTGGTVTDGGNSMSFSTSYQTTAGSGTLNGTGTASFLVGGALTVGANQAAGNYVGSYSATVAYN